MATIAVIVRRNRAGRVEWCFPRGHSEEGRDLEQTAVRLVSEDTGIVGLMLASLGTIDYSFPTTETRVHKVVHHYLLEATGGEFTAEDDPDADAIDVVWLSLLDARTHLTFANERRIAQEVRERLAGAA